MKQTTKYRYDGSGNLVYLEDDLGQKHTYVYNRLGQIIAQYVNGKLQKETTYNETGWPMTKKNAAGQTETYTYQNNGLVKRYTDKAGQHYNYTYTAQHEEERLSITNASGGEVYWKQNGYDPNSRLLTSTSNSEGNNLSYQYDIWKRLKRQTAAGRNYTFEYDGFDRLQALVYPEGQRVTYGYDNLHRIKSVQYAGMGTVQYGYAIGSNENRYDIQYPNGVRQEKRTDAFKELTSQRSYKGAAADWNETFAHDGMGNISGMNRNGKNHQFQYDGLNRIREENGPDGFTTYTYDDRGNRQTMESSVRPNFAWTSQDLTYNALNQLKTYTNHSNQNASYSYYPDGLRAVKTVNGQTTKYVYLNGRVIEELDGGGNVKARNIWGNELLWRQDNSTGKSGYYVYNGHGDVVAIKDGNGNNLNTYDYDIWGNVRSKTEGMNNPYRYTGEPQDDESGLIYLRARYYDPTIGRFIQQDTYEGDISNPLTLNLYTYVGNNPLTRWDPSGNAWINYNQATYLGQTASSSAGKYEWALSYIMSNSFLDENQARYLLDLAMKEDGEGAWAREQIKKDSVSDFILRLNEGTKLSEEEVAHLQAIGEEFGYDYKDEFVPVAVGKRGKSFSKVGCHCFTAGTKVLTDEGEKPIEEIEVGDKVLAKSDETGEVAYKEVVGLFQKQADEIYYIHIDDEIIEVTGEHPFWLDGKGWTLVKDLKVGDLLVSSGGSKLAIDKIEKEPREATVYNFEVEDFNSYFVSNLGIWVHNCAAKSGMNNVRVMQDTKIKGYKVSMDVERGGSGLVNIHVKVDSTKYFYNAEKGMFFDGNGNKLPGSLRGNKTIEDALKKAQKYEKRWSE